MIFPINDQNARSITYMLYSYYEFIYLLEREEKGKTDLRQLDVKNEDEQVFFCCLVLHSVRF